ncbi:MAG: hypothetical protein LBR31_09045 [Desulfovibrio sp.]|jgi:hypothetical protein|nr:hypothetical protein [Desulfovibrio sp.]
MNIPQQRSRPALVILAALAVGLLAACAREPDDTSGFLSLAGDFSTPFQIHIDNFVRRQPPAVYVSPRGRLDHKPKALFVPLRFTQQISNPVSLSTLVSRQVWQVWLSLGGFEVLEFAPDYGPFETQRSLALARAKGAEFLVGGHVNHYMDGGSGGESSVSLDVEIYDVKSGNLVWHLAQGGLMEARQVHDFYLFSIKERIPGDPAGLVTRALAYDMGRRVAAWGNVSGTRNAGQGRRGEGLVF